MEKGFRSILVVISIGVSFLEVYHIVDVDRICNIKHQNKDISDFNIQIIMTNQQIYEWLKRIKITTQKE